MNQILNKIQSSVNHFSTRFSIFSLILNQILNPQTILKLILISVQFLTILKDLRKGCTEKDPQITDPFNLRIHDL